jgi:hypothetical protein
LDGEDHLTDRRVLGEVPNCAGTNRPIDDVAIDVHRHHHDPLPTIGFDKAPRGLDTVHAGHRYIHQHDIGLVFESEADCLRTVAGLGHDLDTFELQCAPDSLAQHRVVIDQDYRESQRCLLSSERR